MRIITAKGEFVLPVGFEAALQKNNVFLNDVSEQTSPITLPGVPENMRLISYSDRIDDFYKPVTDLDIVIESGLMVRRANLGIHSANDEDGISCTVYLAASSFYSLIDQVNLQSLAWPEVKSPEYDILDLDQRVQYLIDLLKTEYLNPTPEANFKIAPLVTDKDVTVRSGSSDTTDKLILNAYNPAEELVLVDDIATIKSFEGEYARDYIEDNNVVATTKGYGITPFLKLQYVLRFIFETYGFKVDFSAIESRFPEFSTVCLENNIADAIYAGIIKYRQLVPNLTVKEFIDKISEQLAGKFIVNDISKTVKFAFYDNILTASPDEDLTDFLSSSPKKGSAEFKELIIKSSTDTSKPDAKIPTEVVEFDFHNYVNIIDTYYFSGSVGEAELSIQTLQCSGSLHLNSAVQVGGETKTEDVETSSRIDLMCIPDEWIEYGVVWVDIHEVQHEYTIRYRHAHKFLTVENIKASYSDLISFKRNSNIPVSCNFLFPAFKLELIDIHAPKVILGQKLLIDSLKYVLNDDKQREVSAVFRTMKPYTDR